MTTTLTENPYSPPRTSVSGRRTEPVPSLEVWREDNFVVCPDGARLPDRCVICNRPSDGRPVQKTLSWHHPAIYLVVFVNLLIYAIVALAVRKKSRAQFSLCPQHRGRRNLGMWIGYGGFVLSVVAMVFGFTSSSRGVQQVIGVTGLVGVILTPLVGVLLSTVVRVKRIDAGRAHLKLGEPFTRSIPRG
ncbi:MAG: hypothetical protein H6837_21925 [Planctomycetes bacterium]|nr:hypothetical protein [Planctomycetota bacterium]MCB9872526.1 hypothetical protein [Planctomycetota bacterium]